jgi:hypothetical protein
MWNYSALYNHPGGYGPVILGYLVNAGLIKDGKAYYCPSESNNQWIYNAEGGTFGSYMEANPWPFPPPGSQTETRFGYATRPVVGWQMPPAPTGQKFYNIVGQEVSMPKLVHLKNKALVADVCVTPKHLLTRHKKGVNVLYSNGGAKWVPSSAFIYQGSAFAKIPWTASDLNAFNTVYNAAHLNDYVPQTKKLRTDPTGLWIDYDRY